SVLRQHAIKIVAGHPAGNFGVAGADVVSVAVRDLTHAAVDLGAPSALPDDTRELLVIGRADPHACAVVGEHLHAAHRIDHLAVGLRGGSAGVVADHPADRAADMGG